MKKTAFFRLQKSLIRQKKMDREFKFFEKFEVGANSFAPTFLRLNCPQKHKNRSKHIPKSNWSSQWSKSI